MSNALVTTQNELPAKIEELKNKVIFNKGLLEAKKAELKVIQKTIPDKEIINRVLAETQDLAEETLYKEAALGDYLIQYLSHGRPSKNGCSDETFLKDVEINKSASRRAQDLAKHCDLIEKIIKEAIENNDIPCRNDILRLIPSKKKTGKSETSSDEEGELEESSLYECIERIIKNSQNVKSIYDKPKILNELKIKLLRDFKKVLNDAIGAINKEIKNAIAIIR